MDSHDDIVPDSEDPSVILETPTTQNPPEIEGRGIPLGSQTLSMIMAEDETVVQPTVDNSHSEDLFKSLDPIEGLTSSEPEVSERVGDEIIDDNDSMVQDREVDEIIDEEDLINELLADKEIEESEEVEEDENEDPMEEDEEEEDADENASVTQLPFGRIKKIMKICVNTVDDEVTADEEVPEVRKTGSNKGKGKARATKKVNNTSTANMIVTKEAIFLTTVATELFIAAVTQQSSKITAATKKKTLAVDHLKRAMSDSECFEFLQGCFQPSLIIGD